MYGSTLQTRTVGHLIEQSGKPDQNLFNRIFDPLHPVRKFKDLLIEPS